MTRSLDAQRYQDARDLMGFTTSLDVDETFEAAGRPYPAQALANAITPLVVNLAKEQGIGGKDLAFTTSDGNISQILWHGINDLQEVLVPNLVLQPTVEAAYNFTNHPKTIQSLAILATYPNDTMSGLIQQMSVGEHAPASATPYLKLPIFRWTPPPKSGCPAAKHKSLESIKPVWSDFAGWVGSVAVRSVLHHQAEVRPVFAKNTLATTQPVGPESSAPTN